MPKSPSGYIGWVCVIDCYNRYIATELIKTKKNKELFKKLKTVFDRLGKFYMISGDGEFSNVKQFFKAQAMYLHTKVPSQKANLVRLSIFQL